LNILGFRLLPSVFSVTVQIYISEFQTLGLNNREGLWFDNLKREKEKLNRKILLGEGLTMMRLVCFA
jgi:hypothetical protein